MSYTLCLEAMENRWIAHVPQLLGCYAEEDTREAAIAAAPAAIAAYFERSRRYNVFAPTQQSFNVHVEEIALEWLNPENLEYTVNAFFAADAVPLTMQEIELAARMLQWNRQEQRTALDGLTNEHLDQTVEDGWSIVRILHHIGRSEWWYLTRLDLAPSAPEPVTWNGRQDIARRRLLDVLPRLVGDTRIVLKDAEVWSSRKMLRRALWHEPDHTQHILHFKSKLVGLIPL